MQNNPNKYIAVFGGGCFWCTEAIFSHLKGVISVVSGYSGGKNENPTYDQVCAGGTGHVEAIRLEYDPSVISYKDLLSVFFYTHDPTTPNRQGNDIGDQYNSTIFYADQMQKSEAEMFIKDLNDNKAYPDPVITSIRPLGAFYEAEDYHRKYYLEHSGAPYCRLVITPKLDKLGKRFEKLVK